MKDAIENCDADLRPSTRPKITAIGRSENLCLDQVAPRDGGSSQRRDLGGLADLRGGHVALFAFSSVGMGARLAREIEARTAGLEFRVCASCHPLAPFSAPPRLQR
jgi:hypothetical protein